MECSTPISTRTSKATVSGIRNRRNKNVRIVHPLTPTTPSHKTMKKTKLLTLSCTPKTGVLTTPKTTKNMKNVRTPSSLKIKKTSKTPQTTSPSTPNTSIYRRLKNGRISYLIYRPLELDGESSSEANDSFLRARHPKQETYINDTPPITPPKKALPAPEESTKEQEQEPPSDFKLGRCTIEEVLRMYGSRK